MNKVPYPCKGGEQGVCKSACCFQAAEALKSIVDLKLSGHPVDPAIFDFPYSVDQETGRCEKLSEDNSFCTVYLDRPLLCDIHKASIAMHLDPMIFMPSNAEACNALMTENGIPKEKQIDVEKYRLELIDQWVKDNNANIQNSGRGSDTGGGRNDISTKRDNITKYPITPNEATAPSE